MFGNCSVVLVGVFPEFCLCAMCIQDLTSQVSMETDPVLLLPKVVSLLYLKVS